MSIDAIKLKFYNSKSSSKEERLKTLLLLDRETLFAIENLRPRILNNTAPRFLRWEYDSLLQINSYIQEDLQSLN